MTTGEVIEPMGLEPLSNENGRWARARPTTGRGLRMNGETDERAV